MSTIAHFSLMHYEHMVEIGAFAGPFQRRIELIGGLMIEMPPAGIEHANVVTLLTEWSFTTVPPESYRIRTKNPVRLPMNESEPEPDLIWVQRRDYSHRHPEPQEVFLLVEVAGNSLTLDRGEKLALYAEAGIPEYWIVNLLDRQIEVHRDPAGRTYRSTTICRGDDVVRPLALPEAGLPVSRLFQR